jgi:hypothetical protein
MSEDFHLIDLVSQARAVQSVLVGTTDTEKLAWLAERGKLEPAAMRPGGRQIYRFESVNRQEAVFFFFFFFDAGEFVFVGDHTTFTMSAQDATDSYPRLPDRFCPRVASYPECSYGAIRVILVLRDGRRIHDVIIGADAICKIGQRLIKSEADLDFSVSDIEDVQRG